MNLNNTSRKNLNKVCANDLTTKNAELKVIIFGLDGADLELINQFIKDGHLPTMEKLIKNGFSTKCKSVIPPVSAPAWTSIFTGVNPGKHGVYDFSQRRRDSYTTKPVFSTDIKVKTLWEILGSFGYKSIVVKVPGTYPPKKMNGILISGFPTPEEKEDFVYPISVLSELREEFGKFKLQPENPFRESNPNSFLKEMVDITDTQTEIVRYLMKKYEWNLLINVFMITDAIPHHFFRFFDKNHPLYNEKKAEKYSDAILRAYQEVDDSINKILKSSHSNSIIFLISDHGVAPVYYAFYTNTWLLKEGYLRIRRNPIPLFKYFLFKLGFNLELVYKLTKSFKFAFNVKKSAYKEHSFMIRLKDVLFLSFSDIDWRRSKAYSIGNFGQIFINLIGREPEGCVDKYEYGQIVNEIIKKLKDLKDQNGKSIFDIINKGEEIYNGPYATKGADIVFMNSESKYTAIRTMELGSNKIFSIHPIWSGTHTIKGIFIASGEYIRKNNNLQEINVYSITPTILHVFGIEKPVYTDGEVLNIFESGKNLLKPTVSSRIKKIIYKLKNEGRI